MEIYYNEKCYNLQTMLAFRRIKHCRLVGRYLLIELKEDKLGTYTIQGCTNNYFPLTQSSFKCEQHLYYDFWFIENFLDSSYKINSFRINCDLNYGRLISV